MAMWVFQWRSRMLVTWVRVPSQIVTVAALQGLQSVFRAALLQGQSARILHTSP